MVVIKTTDKIEKLIWYLSFEISKRRLDPALANIFLCVLWDSHNENKVILQPKWTFAIPDFRKYLDFYKTFNLLHWNGSQTKFKADEDLYNSSDYFMEIDDDDSADYILQIGAAIPEFQKYYSETVA